MTPTLTLSPRGPFSLAESASFGFGERPDPSWDGSFRLAFCADGDRTSEAVPC